MKNDELSLTKPDLEKLLKKFLTKKISKFQTIPKTTKKNYIHSQSKITAKNMMEW